MGVVAVLWWFPDAVSRVRQQTMPYAQMDPDCSLASGPCTASFDDGTQVTLTVGPVPFRASVPLHWEVQTGGPVPAAIELQGTSMNMGLVRMRLEPTARGAWEARAALPVCTTERMEWRADVIFADRTAGFELTSVEPGAGHGVPQPSPSAPAVTPTYPPFTLTTQSGAVQLEDLRGRPAIVYFGYLSCPDVCPTTLATVAAAADQLEERPHVVFVTVDPDRDTSERIASYVQYFGEDFVGGAVAEERLAEVAASWGVVYRRAEAPGSAMAYTMDHSTQAFLLDASGAMVRMLPHGTPAADIVQAVREVR